MTDKEKEQEQRSILQRVDSFTEPGRMSQPEALEFLENVVDELESRVAALRVGMGDDPDEEDEYIAY